MEYPNQRYNETSSKTSSQDLVSLLSNSESTILNENQGREHRNSIASVFNTENLVKCYLESVTLQNNNLMLLDSYKTLLRRDHKTMVDCVKVLSGGAASADPLYSGSIGRGMLAGAVFGELKKSPPALTILEVLRIMSFKNKQGILVIVSNNLANRLNFGSACQSAAQEGIKTLLVSVGEDVSGVCVSKTIGRKGLCGIKFLFKVAGALAEEKKSLYEIHQTIEKLKNHSLGTISIEIRPDTMVIGCGCIGEPEKLFSLWNTVDDSEDEAPLSFIVKQALSYLFHPSSYFSLHIKKGDEIAIIVNNMGNLSDFHFSLVIKEILDQLQILKYIVKRLYTGRHFNSALAGFSISVLKVKDNVLQLLDYPANVTYWCDKFSVITADIDHSMIFGSPTRTTLTSKLFSDKVCLGPTFTKREAEYLLYVLNKTVETVENMEDYLNSIDRDHDFGTAMKSFASAIRMEIKNKSLQIVSPFEFLNQMSYLAGFSMGGVAGGIFGILFSSAAQVFLTAPPTGSIDIGMWVDAARFARDGLQRFTRVKPGDATIIDALDSFVQPTLEHSVKGLSKRVTAAVRGAEASTRKCKVFTKASEAPTEESDDAEVVEDVEVPDAGAVCLAAILQTIFSCLQIELAEAEAERRKRDAQLLAGEEPVLTSMFKEDKRESGEALTNKESEHTLGLKDSKYENLSETVQIITDNISHHSVSREEKYSEEYYQLKIVSDDIIKEIEDEIPNEN